MLLTLIATPASAVVPLLLFVLGVVLHVAARATRSRRADKGTGVDEA